MVAAAAVAAVAAECCSCCSALALHCSAALVVAPAAAALRVAAAVTVCALRNAQSVHGMDQSWYGQGYGHACCALLLGDQDGFLALRSHCHHRDERAQRCR